MDHDGPIISPSPIQIRNEVHGRIPNVVDTFECYLKDILESSLLSVRIFCSNQRF